MTREREEQSQLNKVDSSKGEDMTLPLFKLLLEICTSKISSFVLHFTLLYIFMEGSKKDH